MKELLADAGEDGLIAYDAEMMARPEAVARLVAIRDRTEDKTLKGAARRLIKNVRCILAGVIFAWSSSMPAAPGSVSST